MQVRTFGLELPGVLGIKGMLVFEKIAPAISMLLQTVRKMGRAPAISTFLKALQISAHQTSLVNHLIKPCAQA